MLADTGDFPREARVRRRHEFNRIHKEGHRVRTRCFTVIARRSLVGERPRFGCAVSRKVGRAVLRNRLRRMMKEVFRRSASTLPVVDVVVVVRPEAVEYARSGMWSMAAELVPAMQSAAERAMAGRRRPARRGPRR